MLTFLSCRIFITYAVGQCHPTACALSHFSRYCSSSYQHYCHSMAKVCECAMLTDQYLCFLFISAFSYLETLHSFYKTQCSSPKVSFWFIVWQYIALCVNNRDPSAKRYEYICVVPYLINSAQVK